MTTTDFIELSAYDVDPETGFLPNPDPLQRLPAPFAPWDELGADLPALLLTGKARAALGHLPPADVRLLSGRLQIERAMLLLTTFANAYVWAEAEPAQRIPRALAVPLWHVSEMAGRKPIISHASNVLHNWRRLDPNGGITLDNMATLQPFLGSSDESWFVLVTVGIEARGAAAVPHLVAAHTAIAADDVVALTAALDGISRAIADMSAELMRMYDKCDPHIFYRRVRPFLAAWRAPGVIYEGISETPMIFAGGSAGQSSLIQALDAVLGVRHTDARSRPFLMDMRHYMPPAHRAFVEALEAGPDVHAFVQARMVSEPTLTSAYNQCIDRMTTFRKQHMEIAVRYINMQAPNPGQAVGTGGTSIVQFLGVAKAETRDKKVG